MRQVGGDFCVELFEVHESESSVYLIMEKMEGGTLLTSTSCTFGPEATKRIMQKLLRCLAWLQKKSVIHRDLKPYNIMLSYPYNSADLNKIKLIDFGLATKKNADFYIHKSCGTPGFLAPEIFYKPEVLTESFMTEKIDVFSVGVIFYFLLVREFPYSDRSNPKNIVKNNRNGVVDFSDELFEGVDPMAVDLVKKMLCLNPRDRVDAKEALRHEYFGVVSTSEVTSEYSSKMSFLEGEEEEMGEKEEEENHIATVNQLHQAAANEEKIEDHKEIMGDKDTNHHKEELFEELLPVPSEDEKPLVIQNFTPKINFKTINQATNLNARTRVVQKNFRRKNTFKSKKSSGLMSTKLQSGLESSNKNVYSFSPHFGNTGTIEQKMRLRGLPKDQKNATLIKSVLMKHCFDGKKNQKNHQKEGQKELAGFSKITEMNPIEEGGLFKNGEGTGTAQLEYDDFCSNNEVASDQAVSSPTSEKDHLLSRLMRRLEAKETMDCRAFPTRQTLLMRDTDLKGRKRGPDCQ